MSIPAPVAVAGATGGCGVEIVNLLKERGVPIRALVRNPEKAASIAGPGVTLVEGVLSNPAPLEELVAGARSLVITIGAGPQRREGPDGKPEVFFLPGQTPAEIDYAGNVLLVEAAKRAGVEHIVMLSTLNVTNFDHFLNKMGGGRTLEWKLKAENHLRGSGLTYTVVRPGGLNAGSAEKARIVIGQGDTLQGSVSRRLVAAVTVASLDCPGARNRTFELVAEAGEPTTDLCGLFGGLQPDA